MKGNLGKRISIWTVAALMAAFAIGCGTTTQRMGTEQLLLSDAVDQAVGQIDFSCFAGEKAFLDTTYLKTVSGIGFVNADYIISSLRQQITATGCQLQENRDQADIIIEPRVGALGTNGHDVTYGVPQAGSIASAATSISGVLPFPAIPAIPEISVGRVDNQSGVAKLIVFAFDRETHNPVWQSGVAKTESTSNNTWVLGIGPIQRGSIYKNYQFAGRKLNIHSHTTPIQEQLPSAGQEPKVAANSVSYDRPHLFAQKIRSPSEKSESELSSSIPPASDLDNQVKQASHEPNN